MSDKKDKLIKFIEKELDYDGDGDKDFPSYWIDHKSLLAAKIVYSLGIDGGRWDGDGITSKVFEELCNINITGYRKIDSINIADCCILNNLTEV